MWKLKLSCRPSLQWTRSKQVVTRSEKRTDALDPELALPKLASLAIVLIANLLLQISFFVIIPSSNEYAQYLGGNSTFSGLTIGIPTIFAGLALIPLTRYDGGGYKLPLHVSCAACIVGHVLYSLAYNTHFLYLILIGRIVTGFGFSMFMYCKRYCSDPRIVGVRRRTTLAGFLVMGQGLGMTAGPFFGGVLYKVGFRNPIFNGFTSPGWIMACVWCIFWICLTLWYDDVPRDQEYLPSSRTSQTLDETTTPQFDIAEVTEPSSQEPFSLTFPQIGVIVCMCWFAMTCFLVLGAWESNLPIFGSSTAQLHWSPFASGNFIALGGITAFPFLVMNIFMARRIDDRKILAFGTSLGLAALFIFLALLETNKLNYGSVFICWWAVALGFNMASTVPVSLLSKQLPPSWNNKTSLMIQYSMYTGRVTGAIWGGSGMRIGMPTYVGVEIVFAGIGALLYTVLWRELKTKRG
ncbi:major facilitator superfamily domain-containing protein [Amanita rubescens]|nr:major facilitator superfamily domain-containing protein [Amanita rubescens]